MFGDRERNNQYIQWVNVLKNHDGNIRRAFSVLTYILSNKSKAPIKDAQEGSLYWHLADIYASNEDVNVIFSYLFSEDVIIRNGAFGCLKECTNHRAYLLSKIAGYDKNDLLERLRVAMKKLPE